MVLDFDFGSELKLDSALVSCSCLPIMRHFNVKVKVDS